MAEGDIGEEVTVGYHASPQWEAILREGLIADYAPGCKHIWLAKKPSMCSPTWGVILEVDLAGYGIRFGADDDPDGWQRAWHGGDIPNDRIRLWAATLCEALEKEASNGRKART